MHALIIEDQFLVAALIEDVLRDLGFASFDVVDTEAEAIRVAGVRCPDLVTVDERLSAGSGVSAVRAICANRSIPAVFITEHGARVRRLLPDAIIVAKPFGVRGLRDAVGQAIVSALRPDGTNARSRQAEPAGPPVPAGEMSRSAPPLPAGASWS
ncbi:MAG TPA: response regulator [Allosphingosinicella sp.]|jgi:DNA-binding response OmpR family regulator